MAAVKCSDIIMQLKQIREERGLSYQRIVDMVAESGGNISLSTVRRIFSDGSEDLSYRYEDTIKPLVVALLDLNVSQPQGKDASLLQHEVETLRMVVGLKDQANQELREASRRMAEDYEAKLKYINMESSNKHEHIVALIAQNAANIQRIQRDDHIIFWLASGLIALLALICVVLVVDVMHSDVGYIREISWSAPIAWVIVAAAAVLSVIVYRVAKHAAKKSKK